MPRSCAGGARRRELDRQAREWADLARRFAAVVVAGDCNQSTTSANGCGTTALRARHDEALRDAGLARLTGSLVVDDRPVIDHVCVSGHLAARAAVAAAWGRRNAAGGRMSDHSGVAVDPAAR